MNDMENMMHPSAAQQRVNRQRPQNRDSDRSSGG